MSKRTKPPFRADQVGSLLRPQELLSARERADKGEFAIEALHTLEDRCIRDAIRLQEEVGLESITDGEFRRRHWANDFLIGIGGITLTNAKHPVQFRNAKGTIEFRPTTLEVTDKLAWRKPISVDHFKFVKAATSRTPKQCFPSPTMVHFRSGRPGISAKAYPELGPFFADLAQVYRREIAALHDAGCRYVQFDDTNLAQLCDPQHVAAAKARGEDSQKLVTETYPRLINDCLKDKPKDMTAAVHLCRGNHMSRWMAEGGYDPVAEALFNAYNYDAYFLEYDSPRAGDFSPLRYVPKGKIVVLGIVTSKLPTLESKDEIKRRIDEATKHVPLDQLCLSAQCGFASTFEGNEVTLEDEKAKLRRIVEVANEVWG